MKVDFRESLIIIVQFVVFLRVLATNKQLFRVPNKGLQYLRRRLATLYREGQVQCHLTEEKGSLSKERGGFCCAI